MLVGGSNAAEKKLIWKRYWVSTTLWAYMADFCFSYTNFVVRIQNSGAVATWTKSWWRYRICNKNYSVSFTFPILFCDENTKVGTIAMSSHKSQGRQWLWKYENMKIWKYENMKIWKYENMYENMKICMTENYRIRVASYRSSPLQRTGTHAETL